MDISIAHFSKWITPKSILYSFVLSFCLMTCCIPGPNHISRHVSLSSSGPWQVLRLCFDDHASSEVVWCLSPVGWEWRPQRRNVPPASCKRCVRLRGRRWWRPPCASFPSCSVRRSEVPHLVSVFIHGWARDLFHCPALTNGAAVSRVYQRL